MFSWINFLSYVIVTSITPGPNNIMSMSNGSRLGFRKALPFNLGVLVGFSCIILICTLFCELLSSLLPSIRTPMLFLGAAYMLYLAWHIYKSDGVEEQQGSNSFFSAVLLQFVNVKVYICCIMSMQVYVLPTYHGNIPALLFFALLISLIGFVCTLLWSLFGSAFRLLFSKYAKVTNTIMALLLVYCAVALFF